MRAIMAPALAYALPVFAAGFALGTLRVLWLAPMLGPVAAVALELPVMLAVSWAIAGAVLRRWPDAPRARMGAAAFAILIACEAGLALAFGQSPAAFLAAMAAPEGALGLLGQIGFGLIPLLR